MFRLSYFAVVTAICLVPIRGESGDWPQFRHDANRSAATSESLALPLQLQWVREFPAPRPAFPAEVRLRFDASYEPVVQGHTLFVPSMVTDSVAAFDTRTGERRWEFLAEGPVRFAPVVWEGRVYFVADDGYLYCVDAERGQLLWKFRQLPPEKQDRQVLGNQRLVSLWPARGGPVLKDGVVFFGAGIWTAYGVSVHAVDARTGAALWSNQDSNLIPEANMDHGIANFAGLTPQGYLAVVDERLVVPCGAQLPAFLDPQTGKLDEYAMGWGGRNGLPKGTWFVAGTLNFLSHAGDLYDIRRRNDEEFADDRMRTNFKPHLYAGRYTRISIDPTNQKDLGEFDEPVLDGHTLYAHDDGLVAYDLSASDLRERQKSEVNAERKTDTYPDKWEAEFRELWRFSTPLRAQILAGQHLFLGGRGTVEALRIPPAGEAPRVEWSAAIEGTVHRMLVADGRLFVVTREGSVLSFAAEPRAEATRYPLPQAPSQKEDSWTQRAADILSLVPARKGYALVLGVTTGRLVEELIRQTDLHVIAIDADAEKVAQLRARLHAAGWYGSRSAVKLGDPLNYPLPPYLADLVVSEDWQALTKQADRGLAARVFHSLRPYGGAACLALPAAVRDTLLAQIAANPLSQADIQQVRDWLVIARPSALADAGSWTHEEADAANTGASQERFVKPPMDLLWFDGPARWFRVPGTTLVRVCGGRMFIKADRLTAIDVYTGRVLWEAEFPFRHAVNDQMVATEDEIYVAHDATCVRLDATTGQPRGEIRLPEGLTTAWANLRVWGDDLVGQSGAHVVCFNRRSGQLIWRYECGRANLSLALGAGKVFCAEIPDRRRGEADASAKIHALDIRSGNLLWQTGGGSEVRYSQPLDAVVCESAVYRAGDGSLLASLPKAEVAKDVKPDQIPRPLFVVGKQVLIGDADTFAIYDLSTGHELREPLAWVRRGCTRPRASANMVTTRFRGNAACVDLATFEIVPFWNVRAACSNNLFPADGVLNMPSLTGGCTCNYLPVSQAFVPASAIAPE